MLQVLLVVTGILVGILSLAPMLRLQRDPRPLGTVDDVRALAQRGKLNVLFVLVDTLRADRLGSYGYDRPTSPMIDGIARTGVRFVDHRSQSSWTKASMASLWTSLYPIAVGVTRYSHAIPEAAVMPAEVFLASGYRTAGIWRNGWVAPNFGFDQGFEIYQSPRHVRAPWGLERGNPNVHALDGSDFNITRSALEFFRDSKHEPWLLYLHYMDVHQYAYDEASANFGVGYSDIYDNAIQWVDRNVGLLIEGLDEHGLLDRTVIVLASDHGEEFYEHGGEGHARHIYAEVTRTPLIIGLPFRLEPGIVVEEPTENIDLWPTVFDLLGIEGPGGVHGRSLVDAIAAAAPGRASHTASAARSAASDPTYAHLDRAWGRVDEAPQPLVSATRGTLRVIRAGDRPPELYDLAADPGEHTDIAAREPERVRELSPQLEAYGDLPRPWDEADEVEINALKLGQLRALGYVIEQAGRAR